MKKIVYIILGTISLLCAYIGVVLPLIPFTPFLLFTAFCYAKSSKRLDAWFKNTKLYKDNLESFVKGEGMTKKTKRRVMCTITLVMAFAFAMMFGKAPTIALFVLAIVWVGHMVYFARLVKLKSEENEG